MNKSQEFENYTLDILQYKMLTHLNDLRAYGYFYINKYTIDSAERSMLKAFQSRSRNDIEDFTHNVHDLQRQARRSQKLAQTMKWLMIGSVILSFLAMPFFLDSYLQLNILALPFWVEILTMSTFTITSVVYLGSQAVQHQSLSYGKLSLFHQDFNNAQKGLNTKSVQWQMAG